MRAAKDVARWVLELPRSERPLFVTVNVSGRQLFRPELVQEIRHVLGRNIAPAGTMRLEISESLLMDNPEQAVEVLKLLSGSGVELTLDDFGTGFSSLAYLHRFPFDTIKICGELIRGGSTGEGAAIVRSMVALAHELTKTIAAENVERADEAAFLRSIGCEYAQGYHFGEPISDRAVSQLLKMVRRSERKMQPRGFFRPKTKAPAKEVTKKPAKVIAAQGKSLSQDPKTAANTPATAGSAAGKPTALPTKSVVRQRQKPATLAPAGAEVRPNGKAPAIQTMNGAVNGASPPPSPPPNGSPSISLVQPPASNAGSPPPRLQPRAPMQTLAETANGASGPFASSPGPQTLGQPQPIPTSSPRTMPPVGGPSSQPPPPVNGAPSVSAPIRPPIARQPNGDGKNIVSPLAEALARASAAPPNAPPSNPPSPGPGAPIPAALRSDTPSMPPTAPPPLPFENKGVAFASEPAMQPDFSTLPPSIAASLARLAGGPLPTPLPNGGKTAGGPASSDSGSKDTLKPKVGSAGV